MFAENDAAGADDLFDDEPRSHELLGHGLADAKPSSKARALQCSRCGKEFLTEEEILFCNACGSPLHAAGTVNTVSVVLAEDASVSRRKIAAMLKRLGCRVTEALNGREAVDLASQVKPHLVILDLHMPEMSGMEALDALRADPAFEKTTIVILTAEADASFVRDALARGANDYIRKDSSPTELQERINKHVQNIRSQT